MKRLQKGSVGLADLVTLIMVCSGECCDCHVQSHSVLQTIIIILVVICNNGNGSGAGSISVTCDMLEWPFVELELSKSCYVERIV